MKASPRARKPEYAPLSFPLNVFAHCLAEELGRVDYLHYGLFEQPDDPPDTAQQRSTALVLARQPAQKPADILEIGPGLGTTARALTEAGHRVVALTPDAAQIALARERAPEAEFHVVRCEDYRPDRAFDWILLQESAQYIDSLDLFQRAHAWLKADGQVLILDEFALDRREGDPAGGLPLLSTVLAQAQRCGLALVEKIDLSRQAAPTVDYLLRRIRALREALLGVLPVTNDLIEILIQSLEEYAVRYRDGRYGYVLLRFTRDAPPRWRLAYLAAQHEGPVRDLFARVFAPETMSPALWWWKYGEDRGLGTVAWDGNRLAAHYGGLIRETMFFGQPIQAVQIGDVMAAPEQRGVMTRKGAFYRAAALFPERWVGYGARFPIGFGFPNARAMAAAERMGLYAEVGRLEEVQWPARKGRPRLLSQVRPLDFAQDRDAIQELWQAMARALRQGIVCVRDARYLQHRYLRHPEKSYDAFLVRHRVTAKPLGLIVLRLREDGWYWLIDFVGDPVHLAMCIGHARRIAAHAGHSALKAWFSVNPWFAATGGNITPTEIRVPTSIHTPGPNPETLRDRWWLMAGDTDFQ